MRILFMLLAYFMVSCPRAVADGTGSGDPADAWTGILDSLFRKGYFNGFGVAVADERGIAYEQGFGFADVAAKKRYSIHTIQPVASLSKTVVGIALLKAQELGKLHLDDPVNKYLPFPVGNPWFPEQAITIRHLATHTSTITDGASYLQRNYYLLPWSGAAGTAAGFDEMQVFIPHDSAVAMDLFLKNILATDGAWYKETGFLKSRPGDRYEYSNTATTLAAYIITLATGMDFTLFTRKYIFAPLHMNASSWEPVITDTARYSRLYAHPDTALPPYSMVSYPDGGLITSVHDMGLYLAELIRGYRGRGSILSRRSYRELFRKQLKSRHFTARNRQNPFTESYNVGIFMGFGYTGFIGHTGGDPGVVSILFFDPRNGRGRVLLVNTSLSGKPAMDTFYDIWNTLEAYPSGPMHGKRTR